MKPADVAKAITEAKAPSSGLPQGVTPAGAIYGVVKSIQAGNPATLTLTLGGSSTSIAGIKYLNGYAPTVNDTVLLCQTGADFVVIGAASGNGPWFVGLVPVGGPVSGTYVVGCSGIDSSGHRWVCTAGGAPGTWVSPDPWGKIYYGTGTTNSGVFNTPTQINSQTVTTVAGRRYRIEFNAILLSSGAAINWVQTYFDRGATRIKQVSLAFAAGAQNSFVAWTEDVPGAGSTTYKWTIDPQGINMQVLGAAAYPAEYKITDVGPA